MDCAICDNSGYLDINPDIYCDCAAGKFYEQRSSISIVIEEEQLDILLSNFNINENEISSDSEYYSDPFDKYKALYYFSELPFNISTL